jgi:uncharacterized membrane protein YccC
MKGLLRAVGTLAAAIISIVLFGLFSQDPPLLLASLFLVQAIGAYGFSGPRYQYAWFVFAFTTAIVLGSAMTETGAVETIAFQRATMVGLGLLIVFVADMLLWPAHTDAGVRASLATRARSVGVALREAIDPSAARNSMPRKSVAGCALIRFACKSRFERGSPSPQHCWFRRHSAGARIPWLPRSRSWSRRFQRGVA